MTGYFNQNNNWPDFVKEEDRVEFIKSLHALETSTKFGRIGAVPLWFGVQRFIDDAFVVDTGTVEYFNVDAVTTIVRILLGEERLSKIPIFAGDMVSKRNRLRMCRRLRKNLM